MPGTEGNAPVDVSQLFAQYKRISAEVANFNASIKAMEDDKANKISYLQGKYGPDYATVINNAVVDLQNWVKATEAQLRPVPVFDLSAIAKRKSLIARRAELLKKCEAYDATLADYKNRIKSFDISDEAGRVQLRMVYDSVKSQKALIDKLTSDLVVPTAQLENDKVSLEGLTEQAELLKSLLGKVTAQFIQSVDERLTSTYRYVFDVGEEKSVRLSVEERYGKSVFRLMSVTKSPDGTVFEESVEDSEGGGVKTVLGIIFLMMFILQLNLPRFLFLDEALACLSSDCLDRFVFILKQFATDANFAYYVINHDERLLPLADHIYEVKDGKYTNVK